MPYLCVAFLHTGNVPSSFSNKVCSAILLDSFCHQLDSGKLTWSGQNVSKQPADWSAISDAFDVKNGRDLSDVKAAGKVTHLRQDISGCTASSWNKNCRIQFETPADVFVLRMSTHLAGCVTKTIGLSPQFACSFVNYAQHRAWKRSVFQMHNVCFSIDAPSVSDNCLHVPSSHILPTDKSTQNAVNVHQVIVVLMTASHQHWIDYRWYGQLIDVLLSWL